MLSTVSETYDNKLKIVSYLHSSETPSIREINHQIKYVVGELKCNMSNILGTPHLSDNY